jgi:Asp-tRNA(Asn)/Glu-tRNA(Gln) amidotransferase A subunit family amidase
MDELTKLSATNLAALIRTREVSPVEVVETYLRRIERVNPKLNAIVTLAPDALDLAREAESAIMRGDEVGMLHGVPITIKDTIETKGLKTTSGSRLRAQHVPHEDALAVARLRAAGAIILGKTNVPEMAIPYECENPVFGRTNNPHDVERTSGGSSGGEAAAISACLSPAGLGSDLSGSIRVPAHFCGIFGLKPSVGRTPSSGHIPSASWPLSHGAAMGPMARHVEDISLLLKVLTAMSFPAPVKMPQRASLSGLRVAPCVFGSDDAVTDETLQAIQAVMCELGKAGLVIVEEEPPGLERAAALWLNLFSRASVIQLRDDYAGHEAEAGGVVRAVLSAGEKGARPSFDEFSRAWDERDALRAELIEWMNTRPLIIAPVGATHAFEHGARRVKVGGRELSIFQAFKHSRSFNVLGLPCVSVPAGRSKEGLPIGVQIIGKPFDEETVLAAASVIEESLGGWMPPPSGMMT